MSLSLDVPVLVGKFVTLEPLDRSHVPQLAASADEDRATYDLTPVPSGVDGTTWYVDELLAGCRAGHLVPFAQVDSRARRAVGVTRFMTFRYRDSDHALFAVEIGGTWLAASAQRSAINTEAKLLLMSHAFDVWGVARLDLKTDARNERSRAAMARLGATFEGVLRQWQPSVATGEESLYRDTAMFSVVATEWPTVRERLASRLG